jgi:exopolyphosphatase / guanosine-5'-triphosphate,3'-diphosphate pyrophosphatase
VSVGLDYRWPGIRDKASRLMATVSLFRGKESAAPLPGRVAIIDIGSNSIRLVVYDGPARIPAILFNEKVLAGLGRGLAKNGVLDAESMDRAFVALARFRRLAEEMRVTDLRVVATAAVREASNGHVFLDELHASGLAVELLSGEEEAAMAGYGVLAGIPEADGIVGDLGGGSLELVRVRGGKVHEQISLPLGVLRIGALRAKSARALDRALDKALDETWQRLGAGKPFYMVGGSWRALARLDMHLTGFPLAIVHHYRMPPEEAQRLVRVLAHIEKGKLREVAGMSSGRIPTLPDAAALLAGVGRRLGSSGYIVSAYGLREGLLHRSLPAEVQADDPLLCAVREEAALQGRFPEHGDLLNRWIAPLFGDETSGDARLRLAACLLADIGWRVHPEFRAERGLEAALHGNWVGIDARGRALMARALWTSFGGGEEERTAARLLLPDEIVRADRWGLAMRLGQRLGGGVADTLLTSRLSLASDVLTLHLAAGDEMLYGEAVERRLKALATALKARPAVGVV